MLHETRGAGGRNRAGEKGERIGAGPAATRRRAARRHPFSPRTRSTTRHMAQAAAER